MSQSYRTFNRQRVSLWGLDNSGSLSGHEALATLFGWLLYDCLVRRNGIHGWISHTVPLDCSHFGMNQCALTSLVGSLQKRLDDERLHLPCT